MEELSSVSSIIKTNSILFFDMDGTLIDTDLANFLSYKKAIEDVTKYNIEINFEKNIRFNRSVLKTVLPNLTTIEYSKIIQRKEDNYVKYLSKTILNKSVVDILQSYCKSNKSILVTNSRENRAANTIRYHGLSSSFSSMFYRKVEKKNLRTNKYEHAISNLKISADCVIVFENEESEIKDAIMAGVLEENIINVNTII